VTTTSKTSDHNQLYSHPVLLPYLDGLKLPDIGVHVLLLDVWFLGMFI
jgi:hypothetical protein